MTGSRLWRDQSNPGLFKNEPMSISRRGFIQTTTTALILSSLDMFANSREPAFKTKANFDLKVLATEWGYPGSLQAYCAQVKKEGYDGI